MMIALMAAALAAPMFPDDPTWTELSDNEFSTAWVNMEPDHNDWYPTFRIASRSKKNKQSTITVYVVNCRDLSVATSEVWLTTDGTVRGVIEGSPLKDGTMSFLPLGGKMHELAGDACSRYLSAYREASK